MLLFPVGLVNKTANLVATCQRAGLRIATAESCTGGLLCALLTEVPGASRVVERGFIAYSNAAKIEVLDVPADLLQVHGAVSESVACAMATGLLNLCSNVALTIAVTGIAGPDGGSGQRPAGLVHLAAARRGASVTHQRALFPGDRTEVRLATVATAIAILAALVPTSLHGRS
ncbi:C-terminal domain of CinA type S [invertebrate metagenome]|uniref:C-terminal domain of CinA type S n=1 Tax=invertebrate metagenome TaxID=1711999 RepID=A0A484H7B7_9ZZZZ